MQKMRTEILIAALDEMNKHDDDMPFPGRYMAAGHDWCGEFVSYVYKQAGCPLNGGSYSSKVTSPPDDGDWMLRSSTRIVDWFAERNGYTGRMLSHPWYDFKPQTGDFVFISRARNPNRTHCGLVWYLANSGDLWTIEGNNAGRSVDIYCYEKYLINKTDDGQSNGIVMGFGDISVMGDVYR